MPSIRPTQLSLPNGHFPAIGASVMVLVQDAKSHVAPLTDDLWRDVPVEVVGDASATDTVGDRADGHLFG